ncbi:MAG: nuoK [Actinobacteria bacterium]|nr:nuoK [Actinomycetota bacterium]
MMEPTAYLLLSGILFGIGVVGVVARKNVLIILMSVEIMLNGVNVAFIADFRLHGDDRGGGRGGRGAGDPDRDLPAEGDDRHHRA